MQETLELWEQFKSRKDVELIISDVVIKEILRCKEPKRSFMFKKLAQIDYTFVHTTDEEENLASIYLQNGILREKSLDDLTHIATAALNRCRYIVSWNFKHFVNPKTIDAVNSINLLLGLPQMSIFAPTMMLGGF